MPTTYRTNDNNFEITQTRNGLQRPYELADIHILLQSVLPSDVKVKIFHDDKPDFKISIPGKPVIGIEHVQCYAGEDMVAVNSNCFEKVCRGVIPEIDTELSYLKEKRPNYYDVIIDYNQFTSRQTPKTKKIIKQEFKEFVLHLYNKGDRPKQSSYIQNVHADYYDWAALQDTNDTQQRPFINVTPSMCYPISTSHDWPKDYIIDCINQKQDLLEKEYKQLDNNSDITEWWLCISVPYNALINPTDYNLPKDFITTYDKIYIVNILYSPIYHKIYDAKESAMK